MGFFLLLAAWLAFTIACGYVGSVMGYERAVGEWGGLALGLLLGPFGLLILLFFPKERSLR